jgi:hypothetical protein
MMSRTRTTWMASTSTGAITAGPSMCVRSVHCIAVHVLVMSVRPRSRQASARRRSRLRDAPFQWPTLDHSVIPARILATSREHGYRRLVAGQTLERRLVRGHGDAGHVADKDCLDRVRRQSPDADLARPIASEQHVQFHRKPQAGGVLIAEGIEPVELRGTRRVYVHACPGNFVGPKPVSVLLLQVPVSRTARTTSRKASLHMKPPASPFLPSLTYASFRISAATADPVLPAARFAADEALPAGRRPLLQCPSQGATQHDAEALVELRAGVVGQRLALSGPGTAVREHTNAHCKIECADEVGSPGFQVGVPQPDEPRVAQRQTVGLLEEPKRETSDVNGWPTDASPQSSTRNRSSRTNALPMCRSSCWIVSGTPRLASS